MASDQELDTLFDDSTIRITLHPEEIRKTILSYRELLTFLATEIERWKTRQLPGDGVAGLHEAVNVLNRLPDQSLPVAKETLQAAMQGLESSSRYNFTFSETADGQFIHSLEPGDIAVGAFHVFHNRTEPGSLTRVGYFAGVLRALVFKYGLVGQSAVVEAAEREAFQTLRGQIEDYRARVGEFVAVLERDQSKWKSDTQEEVGKWFQGSQNAHTKAIGAQQSVFDTSHAEWEKKVASLELSYAEHLKLEAPCKYWAELSTEYQKAGKRWMWLTIVALLVFGVVVEAVLYWPPGFVYTNEFTYQGLRAALLAGALVSVVVYVISLLVRLATSNFHLSRDAKEREQLTLVYLALIKNSAATDSDRQTILAALFSRADTGLLKHDGGPSFPALDTVQRLASGRGGK